MLQAPALALSIALASAYAAAFYLWRGRRLRDLLLFWLASAVGFAAGQIAGQMLNTIPWTIGQVHVIEATLIALALLIVAAWLRQEEKPK
jgi:MFS family permease